MSYLLEACEQYAPDDRQCICINNGIFVSDSAWATLGVGARMNNPCNVRPMGGNSPIPHSIYKASGNGYFASFPTLRDGVMACVELYARKYSGLDPVLIVKRWAGTDNPDYHTAVAGCF